MKKRLAAACMAFVLASPAAMASSHREAPFITKNPKIDGTDLYAFQSYETGRTGFTTLIANYLPLQDAYGGPNYFSLDPEALYEIHIDNTGDGVEDKTFSFRFNNALAASGAGIALPISRPDGGASANVAIPLINAGVIGNPDGGAATTPGALQNVIESYTITQVTGNRRTGTRAPVVAAAGGAMSFAKPIDNIGSKTFPNGSYETYARQFIHSVTIPGCATPAKVFVGQRKEGFAVNLGTIFDLINAPASVITDPLQRGTATSPPNPIGGKNVTTIAMEISTACLTSAAGGSVIGVWTTASVRQARLINPTARYATPSREGGAWVQVSRLGNPLVNEVVIGVPDKDRFNTSEPKDDVTPTGFATYVTNPTLPKLINILFGVQEPTAIPRTDLVTVFATGVPMVTAFNGTNLNPTPAEYLRLNTAVTPTAAASQNNLGAAACFPNRNLTPNLAAMGCDAAGFPNGRRPGDDVVDIALRVMMGYLVPAADAPVGNVPFHDAVLQDQSQFDTVFPYLKAPNPGS